MVSRESCSYRAENIRNFKQTAVPRDSTELSVDDSSRNGADEQQVPLILETTNGEEKLHHQGQERSKDTTGSGFEIQGKGQLPDDNLAIQKRKKGTEPPHDKEELPSVQFNGAANGMTIRGKTQQETEPSMSTMARENRARKGKDIISENLTPAREDPENVFPEHFISVAANINEKSDAFIRRKKEEMRRNLSLER
ncbi:hypothetical protein OIU84_020153 [Salix udensis]|uniref:Uncharacterized protein n=1 Tax=Salix udensis TaxID=889485 RepID=A0AAD6L1W4_9ROSI|nr:hypothetical protein OIU84_020153 [Salix udensis]